MAKAARKVADKRTAMIDAAVSLFAARGFHGTTVPDIARKAGVATGSIYRYFATKEDLVNACLRERKLALAEALGAAFGVGGDGSTRFRRAWRALVAYAIAHPTDFRFLELHHHGSYCDASSRAIGDRVMQAAGAFLREVFDDDHGLKSEVLASLIWGGLVGLLKSADQGIVRLDPRTVDAAGLFYWRAMTQSGSDASATHTIPIPANDRERTSP